MFKRILAAFDGSPTARRGLKAAIDLARDQQATLYVLHLVDEMPMIPAIDGAYVPPGYYDKWIDALHDEGRKVLGRAEAAARKEGVNVKPLLLAIQGHSVADAIVSQARRVGADVIVLGTHGRRGLSRVVMGSDAEGVVRTATMPVMLVRAPGTVPTLRSKAAALRSPRQRTARGKAAPAPALLRPSVSP